MAHLARINELAESLVIGITGRDRDDVKFRQISNETTKRLRSSGHARTNQFEVRSKLEGLVEKFSVLNRDDIAEKLQTCLDELPAQSKWLPEILSLLLQLSDRPAEQSNVEHADSFAESLDEEPPLTWREIITDASLDDTGIWDTIERGYHSSDDEATADDGDETASTSATSVADEDIGALASRYVLHPNENALEGVRTAHARVDQQSDNLLISELMVIRESLSMLHGLPTRVYDIDSSTGVVSPRQKFSLATANKSVLEDMINCCATIGSSVNALRQWLRIGQKMFYLQSCQASTQTLLAQFGSKVATLEAKYVSPQKDAIASIMDVRSEVESSAKALICLSRLVQRSSEQSTASPFALLDLLFEETCVAQLSGDVQLSATLGHVFAAGLRTYLKPVSTWVQTGSLVDLDQTFFVVEANGDCELGEIWRERFAMRASASGRHSVPVILQGLADQIFALGKSRAFLETLKTDFKESDNQVTEDLPDLTSLLERLDSLSLMPFSQMLADTLDVWIADIGNDCTSQLCKALVHEHGLLRTFDGLATAFCSNDGRLFQLFADTLFWRMDSLKIWKDRFLLTELAQSTLGSYPGLNMESLSVRLTENHPDNPSASLVRDLETIKLETTFTWPIQNITRSRSPDAYSKALTLLLQVYRAKYLLRYHVFDLRGLDVRRSLSPYQVRIAMRLRQSFVALVDILHNHVTTTVSSLSTALHRDIAAAETIDAMADIWAEHEKQVGMSLLSTPNMKLLRDTITQLLELSEKFCHCWRGLMDRIRSTESSGGHDALNGEAASDETVFTSSSSLLTLIALRADFDNSFSFIAVGLRATSRAGGNSALEALADRLEWSVIKR